MKKIIYTLLCGMLLSSAAQAQTIAKGDKVLVVYYSKTGNTKTVAEHIQKQTSADILEIEPQSDYPQVYDELTAQAKKEIADGYHPALKNTKADLSQYQVIFVGSPCWWSTIAPPVATFLAENDFAGKKVVPFMTHGGSGLGHSVEDIQKLLPQAEVAKGESFWGKTTGMSGSSVKKWVKGLYND